MSSAATEAPRRSAPRWLWIALIASLAANLFVVGVVVRSIWPGRYASANHGPGGLYGNLLAYTRTLPEDRRTVVRQGLGREQVSQTLRPLREELRAARREAAQLFRSDGFDRTAFLAAEARVQAAESKLRQAIVQVGVEIAGRMSAAERVDFLSWRGLHQRPGRGAHAEREGEAPAR